MIPVEIVITAVDKASAVMRNVGGSVNSLEENFKKLKPQLMMVGAAFAATGAAGLLMINNLVGGSAKLEALTRAFESLKVGSTLSLDALKEAARGTVAQIDLITSANRAMMLGIDPTFLPEMMNIARTSAVAMGISTTQAFDNMVTGIGRQSRLILDNLGIIVKADEAYDTFAASLGKTAGELTNTEKRQAFLNAAMEAGREHVKRLGDVSGGAVEAQQQLTAAVKDLSDSLGQALLPAFTAISSVLTFVVKSFNAMPTPIKNVATVALLAGSGLMAIVGSAILLGPVVGSLSGGFTVLAAAIGAESAVSAVAAGTTLGLAASLKALWAAMGPVGWAILTIGAAITGLYLAWESNFLGIQNVVASLWGYIQPIFDMIGGALSFIGDALNWLGEVAGSILGFLFPENASRAGEAMAGVGDAAQGMADDVSDAGDQIITTLEEDLVGESQRLIEEFKECSTGKMADMKQDITGTTEGMIQNINELINNGLLGQAQDAIAEFVECSTDKQYQMVQDVEGYIADLADEYKENEDLIAKHVADGNTRQADLLRDRNSEIMGLTSQLTSWLDDIYAKTWTIKVGYQVTGAPPTYGGRGVSYPRGGFGRPIPRQWGGFDTFKNPTLISVAEKGWEHHAFWPAGSAPPSGLGGNVIININNPQVGSDYDVSRMVDRLEEEMRLRQIAHGFRGG